ncbi:unnamed protein product [Calypogeia fissa]
MIWSLTLRRKCAPSCVAKIWEVTREDGKETHHIKLIARMDVAQVQLSVCTRREEGSLLMWSTYLYSVAQLARSSSIQWTEKVWLLLVTLLSFFGKSSTKDLFILSLIDYKVHTANIWVPLSSPP